MSTEIRQEPTPQDGGNAFPFRYEIEMNGTRQVFIQCGMSLRDWFAGQTLEGLMASNAWIDGKPDRYPSTVAATCYSFADAMLAEREKKPTEGAT